MIKHIATIGGIGLAVAFIVVFFVDRSATRRLGQVAPRVCMSDHELMALAPRIAASSGATLGSSRHVVYLLACSGRSSRVTLEAQAERAGSLARRQRLSVREAVVAVLASDGSTGATARLKGC